LGRDKIAQMLLASGADVNARDGEGKTALMWAAWKGDDSIVRTLLANGADLNAAPGKAEWVGVHPSMGLFLHDQRSELFLFELQVLTTRVQSGLNAYPVSSHASCRLIVTPRRLQRTGGSRC